MLELFGFFSGVFGSLLPEIVRYFKTRQDQKHELEVMRLQLQGQAQGHRERLEEIEAQADVQESLAVYKAAERKTTGVRWVDATLEAINALVRPTVTFLYLGAYIAVKIAAYSILTGGSMTPAQAIPLLWGPEDRAVYATVIGFWFGARNLLRNRQGAK